MKNWKKYGFEFLSIFVAVILAFIVNNWNENRKNALAERKILTEIYNGLEKDLKDLELNVSGHKLGVQAVNYFENIVTNKPQKQELFLSYYFCLTRNSLSIQNTSGYETLKSRGLELIQNNKLSAKIIELYEYDYSALRKIEEDYSELQFQDNYYHEINSLIAGDFEFDTNNNLVGIKQPLNLGEKERKLILSYLWKIHINRNFILSFSSDVKKKIESTRRAIKKELE